MYKNIIWIAVFVAASAAAEEGFEINKKNCNLPLKEISKRVTDRQARKVVLSECMKKSAQEKWMKKTLLTTGRSQ